MAELADAYGSGPYGGNFMQVQVLFPAPWRVFLQHLKSCEDTCFLFITFFYLLQGGEVHCVECFSRLHLSVAIVIALSFGAEYAKSRAEIMLLNKSKQNCCDAYICDYAFVYKREHGFKAYNTLE